MRHYFFTALIVLIFCIPLSSSADPLPSITLDGQHLTIEDLISIARQNTPIEIDSASFKKVERSHQLLLLAAEKNIPIYGVNRGVGLNKDKTIFKGNILTPHARKESEKFNMNDIYATSAAIGEDAPRDVVRAAMAVRLNTLLLGHSGVHPSVVKMLFDFLNNDITPIFPSEGSVGEADITILAHIALSMTGEGKVWYKGKQISAREALKKEKLTPLHLYAKDALSIFSSNAYTAGKAALAAYNVENLINKYDLVLALSLEGINGNISPFIKPVQTLRPYQGQEISAHHIITSLEGSYLLETSLDRALQDPLSFRTASQVSGTARATLNSLKKNLTLQLNSSDDNPAVILDISPSKSSSPQEKAYYIHQDNLSGAVIPTANFDSIPWVLDIEKLNIALGHLSASSTQRIVKLSSFQINHLSRFLAPNETTIAFAAIQKPIMYLNTKIQQLISPISTISYPVAGEIEDTATNSLLAVQNLNKIVDSLYQIMGFELLHASQAIDLKKAQTPNIKLGKATAILYADFRKLIPFLQKDRELTPDIKKAYQFITKYSLAH